MKFLVIPYIALGLVLSIAIGIEYECEGQEMFGSYYGSPFIFKQKSLGSSMTYYFSISGVVLNTLLWSTLIYLFDLGFVHFRSKVSNSILISRLYKFVIGLLIVFTTFNIAMDYVMLGRGFDKNFNYWYWDTDKEASDWGVTCNGKLILFKK